MNIDFTSFSLILTTLIFTITLILKLYRAIHILNSRGQSSLDPSLTPDPTLPEPAVNRLEDTGGSPTDSSTEGGGG